MTIMIYSLILRVFFIIVRLNNTTHDYNRYKRVVDFSFMIV